VAVLKKSLGKNDGKEISDMGPCQFTRVRACKDTVKPVTTQSVYMMPCL
jgi:hypothetical protein